ncbi:MAG: sigma-70 family RNA polymerase sigma factor [Bacteroidota bacterium]
MKNYTDDDILAMLGEGSRQQSDQAFRFLYAKHFRMIDYFIQQNNGNEQDAEDIFQDSLIVLYNKVRTEKLELTCALKTYIFSICRNLWLKKLKKAGRSVGLKADQEVIALEEDHFSVLLQDERQHLIANLLDKMGEDCKRVILLFYYKRLRMNEIAEQMGLSSEQVAKNKKSNCLKKLRSMVKSLPQLKDSLR